MIAACLQQIGSYIECVRRQRLSSMRLASFVLGPPQGGAYG